MPSDLQIARGASLKGRMISLPSINWVDTTVRVASSSAETM